jgi:hypothetical protein
MNAQVQTSLLLSTVAAKEMAKCRAILAGEEMTPEQSALSEWWGRLRRIERAAFFMLAGVNHGNTGKQWMQLPPKQRAALVLVAGKWAENMQAITGTLKALRKEAADALTQEARKASRPRVQVAA